MAAVLGVSALYHDAAAALVVDGAIVAAIHEERLSRIKHDPSLPVRAIEACLARGGVQGAELDRVAFYENPYAKLERVLVHLLRGFPRTLGQFPRALSEQLRDKLWVLDRLAGITGAPRDRVRCVHHHESHAASAFFASPYERAAVLTVDGVGEETTTAIWAGDGDSIEPRGAIAFPHSLGLLYAAITAWLGFRVNGGEYKVMGLAAYGSPTRREAFARLIRLEDDGSYALELGHFGHHAGTERPFAASLEALLGPARRPGAPWDLERPEDRARADVAATLQAVTEEALLGLARRARREVGADHLCLAGGVALDAVANGRLLRESGFERIFVQPAAGDAGGALGAAILGAIELGDPRPAPLTDCALGLAIDPGRGADVARELGLVVRGSEEPQVEIAARIARGELVAVCAGRFEWGPRALGHRSILADPADVGSRERLNRKIKRREPFRPFAPAVLGGAVPWFEGAPNDMTPFMTCVCPVDPAAGLPAVTHVDGTARVQTVDPASWLGEVLTQLDAQGRPPAVLNTSLNAAGEPIVGGAEDALGFFLSHGVDALYLEDVVVEQTSVSGLRTIVELVSHFARRGRWFLLPLLVVLLLSGLLLIATGGLSYVAPFVYTLF